MITFQWYNSEDCVTNLSTIITTSSSISITTAILEVVVVMFY